MNSEMVASVFKIIAVAAPVVFILLLLIVVAGNFLLVAMVRRRNETEARLSRVVERLEARKLIAFKSKEDFIRMLAEVDEGESRARVLQSKTDLTYEDESELHKIFAEYAKQRKTIQECLSEVKQTQSEHSEVEEEIRDLETRLQKARDEMRQAEENYAHIAILINRFVEYTTNGLKVVATESKPARPEAGK